MASQEKTAPKQPSAMSVDEKKRFKELFDKLDVNKDGKVEIGELAEGLRKLKGVSSKETQGQAEVRGLYFFWRLDQK